MRGSILVTFDEAVDDKTVDYIQLSVNGVTRDKQNYDSNSLYSTFMDTDDVVSFGVFFESGTTANVSIIRRDYTTDAEGNDRGIKETPITPFVSASGTTSYVVQFTGSTIPSAYNFHYIIDASTT